jgi:signal transduction histidine kinase
MAESTDVYLRANQPFWFWLTAQKESNVYIVRIDRLPLETNGFDSVSAESIDIPEFRKSASNYDIYQSDDIIVIRSSKSRLLRMPASTQEGDLLRMLGNAHAESFRNKTKTKLLNQLTQPSSTSTIGVLSAFRDYTYFDNVSAWLFNDATKTFTRISGDLSASPNHIEIDKCEVLKNAILKPITIQYRVPSVYDVPDVCPESISCANVFNINTKDAIGETHGISVVICIYSKLQDYSLREETRQLITSFLQQNFANRYFDRFNRLTTLRDRIRLDINMQNPKDFLQMLAEAICDVLLWESCSIFLLDKLKQLRLEAQCPPTGPKRPTSYKLTETGLTVSVFKENRTLWSYDIFNDPRNTHKVDDITKSEPRDWIGVPIASNGSPMGVLRVKNKRASEHEDDSHFSSFDMHVLHVCASEIASILEQAHLLEQRKLLAEQRSREVSELTDFLRTLRHEIRSPIQAFCYASERIAFILQNEGMISYANIPKRLKEFLQDLKATGDRLEMMSKSLTLNPDEIVNEMDQNNLYLKCIAPILAYAAPYATKRKRTINVDKDSLLVTCICDAVAISMAFHALVDNAIKYTDVNKSIKIYGKSTMKNHQVIIESNSDIFEIPDKEQKLIREKYYRGDLAKTQKLVGSGIGLYLADQIMSLHGGQLLLLKNKNPVTFSLILPRGDTDEDSINRRRTRVL